MPEKKINRSRKGQVVELKAIKILEAQGYRVHRCVRTGAKRGPFWVSQSNDIYGCIDVIAKKKGERTRWIQVTADSGISRKSEEMLGIPWDLEFDVVEIWRWVGGHKRNHKITGAPLDSQYFQTYRLCESTDVSGLRGTKLELSMNKEGEMIGTMEGVAFKVSEPRRNFEMHERLRMAENVKEVPHE